MPFIILQQSFLINRSKRLKGKRLNMSTGMLVNKNDELIIEIDDIGSEGEGIGKYQGYTLFVKNTLPGDKVKVKQ